LGVTLKLATSLDGRIATASGESRWITGEEARAEVHRLRAGHDAVVIGIETALADDPELTVRTPGHAGPQPARVVLDSRGRLPSESRLVRTSGEVPTYVVTLPATASPHLRRVEVAPGPDGRPDLVQAVKALASLGLARLFVEGGGQVAAGFILAGLVDRIEWFRAPVVLGGEGRPCIGALALARLADAPRFRRVSVQPLGEDLWERYERV
jgi:diaminohydroxyphosphoribosylaminopyrimidine deaminase / 5-amino-6-(5-phosphoribosylamino)uracil reductase